MTLLYILRRRTGNRAKSAISMFCAGRLPCNQCLTDEDPRGIGCMFLESSSLSSASDTCVGVILRDRLFRQEVKCQAKERLSKDREDMGIF